MYQYEYEKISCELHGWGFGGNVYETDDYRSVIERRAENGWRYVGYIPRFSVAPAMSRNLT